VNSPVTKPVLKKSFGLQVAIGFLFLALFGGAGRIWSSFTWNGGWILLNRAHGPEDYETAVSWFHTATTRPPTSQSAWRGLAWGLINLGAEQSARQSWANLPEPDAFLWQYAQNALVARDYKQALVWLERVQAMQPSVGDAWYYSGMVYETLQDQAAALEAYQEAMTAPTLKQIGVSDIQTRQARLWHSRGEVAAALEAYQAAEQVDDFTVPYNRALMLTGLGQIAVTQNVYDTAIAYFEAAITEDPSYGWAYFRLGQVMGICCAQWETAVATITSGLFHDPENPWGYLLLGDAYIGRGSANEARMAYEQALRLSPNWSEAEARLTTLHREQ
jgi:tetratricopeptide (TPR) repeat protein